MSGMICILYRNSKYLLLFNNSCLAVQDPFNWYTSIVKLTCDAMRRETMKGKR